MRMAAPPEEAVSYCAEEYSASHEQLKSVLGPLLSYRSAADIPLDAPVVAYVVFLSYACMESSIRNQGALEELRRRARKVIIVGITPGEPASNPFRCEEHQGAPVVILYFDCLRKSFLAISENEEARRRFRGLLR